MSTTQSPSNDALISLEGQTRHADPQTWRPAVGQLALLASHQRDAWQAWKLLLLSENQELKLRGLAGLGSLTADAPELVHEVLLEQIESQRISPDPVFLHEIAALAAGLPRDLQHPVYQCLWDGDEVARVAALPLLLEDLWYEAPEALEAIFHDSSEQVRLALALELCEKIESLDVWAALGRLAEDSSPAVRAAVASGLLSRNEPEALEILAAFSSDNDPAIRAVARLAAPEQGTVAHNLLSEIMRTLPPSDGPEPAPFETLLPWLERPDALLCLNLLADFAHFPELRRAAHLLGVLLNDETPASERFLQGLGILKLAPREAPWTQIDGGLRLALRILETPDLEELERVANDAILTGEKSSLPYWGSLEALVKLLRAREVTLERLQSLDRNLPTTSVLEGVLTRPCTEFITELIVQQCQPASEE